MTFPRPPIDYALTCHVDQLEAEGFGRQDIERYVSWSRGTLRPPPYKEEVRRFGQLALLVILTGPQIIPTIMPTPPAPAPLDMEPSPDFPDAEEGVAYSETITGSGGVPPYVWSATGVPSWATVTISPDTKTWTMAGMPPMSTEMDTIVLTLTDSS